MHKWTDTQMHATTVHFAFAVLNVKCSDVYLCTEVTEPSSCQSSFTLDHSWLHHVHWLFIFHPADVPNSFSFLCLIILTVV